MAILGPDGREIPVLPSAELRYNEARNQLHQMCDFTISVARPKDIMTTLQVEIEMMQAEFRAFLLLMLPTKEAQSAYNNAVVACMEESVKSMTNKTNAIKQHLAKIHEQMEAQQQAQQAQAQQNTSAEASVPGAG